MKIERSALVMYSAMDMYQLVLDVPAYPEFLLWCTHAQVHEQSTDMQLASLGVKVAGIEQQFRTRNTLVPGERLSLALEQGPFRSLSGAWHFRNLGADGSKVSLSLEFDFVPGLISSAFQRGFNRIADHLVQEFVRRADQVLVARTGS